MTGSNITNKVLPQIMSALMSTFLLGSLSGSKGFQLGNRTVLLLH